MGAELEQRTVDETRVRELRSTFDGPVRVITAGATLAADAAPSGCTPEEFNELWQELQEPYLTISTDRERIVAEGSHHHVHLHDPETVVRVIETTLTAARAARTNPEPV